MPRPMDDLRQRIHSILCDRDIDFGFTAVHVESGEEVEINAEAVFPTASVFKVPVMVEVFKQARAGRFALADRLPLCSEQKTMTTGVLLTLDDGLLLTVRDLMTLMTIVSDNTATTMLLELVGADNVTRTMHALGLPSIHVTMTVHEMFLHAFGLHGNGPVGLEDLRAATKGKPMDYRSVTFSRGADNNVSSARDMTRLMAMICRRQVVDAEACDEMIRILRLQQFGDRVPRYLPWYSVGNKTGTMQGLRNDSGIIHRAPGCHIAYTLFTFDPVELPADNSRAMVERTGRVAQMMGEVGSALWSHYDS